MFVEQPLASPGSAYHSLGLSGTQINIVQCKEMVFRGPASLSICVYLMTAVADCVFDDSSD